MTVAAGTACAEAISIRHVPHDGREVVPLSPAAPHPGAGRSLTATRQAPRAAGGL